MPHHQRRRGSRPARDRARSERPDRRPPRATATVRRGLPRVSVVATVVIAACTLIAAGVFVVARSGTGTASCDPDPDGWNGAGGGPSQTGFARTAIHDPGADWRAVWQYPSAGASAADRAVAPPSVAGGTVYTATADGTLVAIDAAKGTREWTSAPGPGESGAVKAPIAVDGCGAVVAASVPAQDGETHGSLRAVDLRTHDRRWGVPADDEIFSAPEIVDGVGYAGLSLATAPGSLDRIHVLDGYYLSDGTRAYRKRFSGAVLASATSDHQRIWIGDLDHDLYALGSGGRQLWTYVTDGIVTLPAAYDGSSVVVISADHRVSSLDPASGREHWTVSVGDVEAAMAVSSGEVAVAGVDGVVHALAAADGTERWHHSVGNRVSRAVVAAGDRIFVVDDAGVVHVLDAATGAQSASWAAPAPPAGPPAIAAGHLYLTCQDGRLYALPL